MSLHLDEDLYQALGRTRGRTITGSPINNATRPRHQTTPAEPEHWPTGRGGCPKSGGAPDDDALLGVCWCGTNLVWLTDRDVLNGRTKPCGLPMCTPEIGLRHEAIRRRRRR